MSTESCCVVCMLCQDGECHVKNIDCMTQVTTEKQREAFKKELVQAEDWLYEDGAAQSGPVFRYAILNLLSIL